MPHNQHSKGVRVREAMYKICVIYGDDDFAELSSTNTAPPTTGKRHVQGADRLFWGGAAVVTTKLVLL